MTKVLIVEDEVLLSDVYATVLSHNGFKTDVACNGLEALDKIPEFCPDVILLDLLMPKMDGVTFLKSFVSDCEQAPTIIVYSNLFDSRKVDEVKALGAQDVVLKSSVTPEGLVDLVRAHSNHSASAAN